MANEETWALLAALAKEVGWEPHEVREVRIKNYKYGGIHIDMLKEPKASMIFVSVFVPNQEQQ